MKWRITTKDSAEPRKKNEKRALKETQKNHFQLCVWYVLVHCLTFDTPQNTFKEKEERTEKTVF